MVKVAETLPSPRLLTPTLINYITNNWIHSVAVEEVRRVFFDLPQHLVSFFCFVYSQFFLSGWLRRPAGS